MEILKRFLKPIDNFLNGITMYRLLIYCLVFLLAVAFYLSVFSVLPIKPFDLLFSIAFLILVCLLANDVFAAVFKAPSNIESVYITALILALIITPIQSLSSLLFLIWAGVLAMASKYILAINKKHIFNPAAISVAITAFAINQPATWWVGNIYILPFVLAVGLLIVRKTRRADLVLGFFATAVISILGNSFIHNLNMLTTLKTLVFYAPTLFFAFFMLTEPITTPPTTILRVIYGGLVGALFGPFVHLGSVYSTPELALSVGNIISYVVSPKEKLVMKLKNKVGAANSAYDFVFSPARSLGFKPGQYLEWTLFHEKPDSRGMRRYFTIASSPTEKEIIMGVKFYEKPSSYKKALTSMDIGDTIVASQLAGDFTLPRNKNKKLVFVAGGIGVTPFRSMVKYLIDRNEKRDIVIFYSNKTMADIAYRDIFDLAYKKLGIQTIHCLSDLNSLPSDWKGEKGFINQEMIKKYVPDFAERIFYVSGPRIMVDAIGKIIKDAGIKKTHIKKDFFSGFA